MSQDEVWLYVKAHPETTVKTNVRLGTTVRTWVAQTIERVVKAMLSLTINTEA